MPRHYLLTLFVGLILAVSCGDKDDTGTKPPEEYEGDEAGECTDGADNDQDGLFDCDDEGCEGSPDCQEGDTDTDSDTDTDTDADGDADADSDSDADTDYTGPCSPPDTWTGTIDSALYTTVPYDSSYDAGLAEIAANLPSGSVSTSSGTSWLVYDATVIEVSDEDWEWVPRFFIADGNVTLQVKESSARISAEVGDRVGFATAGLGADHDEPYIEYTEGWTVLSSENPAYVMELGAGELSFDEHHNQVTHLFGEITRLSSHDCDSGFSCYIVDHDGSENLIRIRQDNDWGLDVDYSGGLCAEAIAPVSIYTGGTGTATFLDVRKAGWMRTWEP